jgi:hypothetical protein
MQFCEVNATGVAQIVKSKNKKDEKRTRTFEGDFACSSWCSSWNVRFRGN